jgi:cephalosporin-C deacetylase
LPIIDMARADLERYRPSPTAEPDLPGFWERTLAEAAKQPLDVQLEPVDFPVDNLCVYRLSYGGWQGTRVVGWFLSRADGVRQPGLVFYHGYSGHKGWPFDYLGWALQGYAVLAVDVRGQAGDTADAASYPGGHAVGWLTMGIESPDAYYYRGVYVDSVRALDALASRPEVDPDRMGVLGVSQGGGLSLAVAALDSRPKVAMPEVPFLCNFGRAVEVSDKLPYQEIATFLHRRPEYTERAFRTLSYFDNLNLADRIRCPVLMTVGLQDLVCPPSTIYAVYHRIEAPRELHVYPYGAHEAFPTHTEQKLRWARRYLMQANLVGGAA